MAQLASRAHLNCQCLYLLLEFLGGVLERVDSELQLHAGEGRFGVLTSGWIYGEDGFLVALSEQNEASYSSSSEDDSLSVGAGGFVDVVSVWIAGEGRFGVGASWWIAGEGEFGVVTSGWIDGEGGFLVALFRRKGSRSNSSSEDDSLLSAPGIFFTLG